MNSSRLLIAVAFVAGFLASAALLGRKTPAAEDPSKGPATQARSTPPAARSIRFYQSPMHPWIKSDRPGRCTICGMELTPVYDGESGLPIDSGTVSLGTNGIQLIHLETTEVAPGPLSRTLRLSGTIDDNDLKHRVISATVAGRIERLWVNVPGQEIRKGEPLVTLYSPALLTAEREYVALAAQPADRTAADPSQLKPLIASARQRLIQMGLTEEQIDALKHKSPTATTSDLLAPADGTVVLKRVYPGQYVGEGERLFETADFSTLWVQLTAYESDLQWLSPGQPARITTPSWPGGVITGKVDYIDPNFDGMTRSTRVRVEVPNPIRDTEAGPRRPLQHRVTAIADLESTRQALTIPRTALLWSGTRPGVYLSLGGGVHERRAVRIGRIGDQTAEVLEGLKAGDRVVTRAAFLIDAQAELQRGGTGGDSPEVAAVSDSAKPTPPAAVSAFLELSAEVSEALAADRLDAFQKAIDRFPSVIPALRTWASDPGPKCPAELQAKLVALPDAPEPGASAGLAEARNWFLSHSRVAVSLARWTRQQGWEAGVRTFECPMVDRAIPSGPKRAAWLQRQSVARNPFFGAEMLDCGLELKGQP